MRQGLSRLGGPPLIVQLIGLLIGALVAAQLVTLLLTLVLPPAPPQAYRLSDIAAALSARTNDDDRFDRVMQSGPPDFSSRGWFVSDDARTRLAGVLHRPLGDVALGFYTQLPVGGTVEPVRAPRQLPEDAARLSGRRIGALEFDTAGGSGAASGNVEIAFSSGSGGTRLMDAALIQRMPSRPPGGGFPGGGRPNGGFPGGGQPGGGFPPSFPQPSSRVPQSQSQTSSRDSQPQLHGPQQSSSSAPASESPSEHVQGEPGTPPVAGDTPGAGQQRPSGRPLPSSDSLPLSPLLRPSSPSEPSTPPTTFIRPRPSAGATAAPAASDAEPGTPRPAIDQPAGVEPHSDDAQPSRDTSASTASRPEPRPSASGRPVPIVRPVTGLFGLAPAPFVEGDFVAGVRLADGRWVIVSPRAEGFPNAWQRRVALWFLLSLLAVAPIAWLFARRIVGPLNDFAHAAETLGRDPSAAVLPLDGPAEIGRAAHAFNQMQSRLRSFVDDRTAMIGAISHDLRTPLTRLRFRIEDVPDEQQDGLRDEVDEMEAMISSVIAFMRDASIPHARERRDLAEIVDDVVEGASVLGDVRAERMDSAIVDVDPLGIRRVLDNLLTNAMKYGGGQARVALRVEADQAVADIVDSGPGVPEVELERIFEPFYRSETARTSDREGSGLGLAVCRSIARAHGGDVALFRSPVGFTARVTLPLAFTDERKAA